MFVFRIIRILFHVICGWYNFVMTILCFRINHVKCLSFRTKGKPLIQISKGGMLSIGKNFSMNNGKHGNAIGFVSPCVFQVASGCKIAIGDNVGISQTAMIALADITIGDYVKIGGGTRIYTTDFHALDAQVRRTPQDKIDRKCQSVHIGNDVFIGGGCFILKGVTIGDRSIVAAGSVVCKSIPADEVWGGNPARFIRKC